jgi:hypothetical protein
MESQFDHFITSWFTTDRVVFYVWRRLFCKVDEVHPGQILPCPICLAYVPPEELFMTLVRAMYSTVSPRVHLRFNLQQSRCHPDPCQLRFASSSLMISCASSLFVREIMNNSRENMYIGLECIWTPHANYSICILIELIYDFRFVS